MSYPLRSSITSKRDQAVIRRSVYNFMNAKSQNVDIRQLCITVCGKEFASRFAEKLSPSCKIGSAIRFESWTEICQHPHPELLFFGTFHAITLSGYNFPSKMFAQFPSMLRCVDHITKKWGSTLEIISGY